MSGIFYKYFVNRNSVYGCAGGTTTSATAVAEYDDLSEQRDNRYDHSDARRADIVALGRLLPPLPPQVGWGRMASG